MPIAGSTAVNGGMTSCIGIDVHVQQRRPRLGQPTLTAVFKLVGPGNRLAPET